ncbi:hypothetical protein SAMN02983003_0168 [Devosia enhydra]|uniref:Cytochrome c domain-containing protein n=1 Tax=Devosia enhydra TaxID=665118 RepID=A0A1K2HT37_9HYPH|nr:hypothetical protein [Devosia enhydra]SFZ80850.1 hypothetical protein SAMN02983003_0168 [Devosia enhydra]
MNLTLRPPASSISLLKIALVCAATFAALSLPALADGASALPPGPKEALAEQVGGDADALGVLLGQTNSVEAWQAQLQGDAAPAVIAALGDYLARIAPIVVVGDVGSVIATLPADGKQLFVENCLSCHGGDTYFLKQDKDFEGWVAIFDAPYHRRLLTGEGEREIFAGYAAATTPLSLDPVPEALADRP